MRVKAGRVLAGRAEFLLCTVGIADRNGCLRIFVIAEPGECGVGESGGVAYLRIAETQALAFEDELDVIDEFHPMRLREPFSTVADEVDVGAFFEDQARGVDRIAEALDAGDAAGFHAASVHEEGVELYAAVGGEKAAAPSVEGGIVFEEGDGCFDGIDGRATTCQDFVPDLEGAAHAGFVCGCGVGRNGPCAAMNQEGGIVSGG